MKWIQTGDVEQLVDLVSKKIKDAEQPRAGELDESARSGQLGRDREPEIARRTSEPGPAAPTVPPALRATKARGGRITPAAVAVDGNYSLDECKECLGGLVRKGHAELQVRETGSAVYVFPDLVLQSALVIAPIAERVGPCAIAGA